MPKRSFAHEFGCPHEGCKLESHKLQIGKTIASPLSGFIAGVIFASIIFLPVLYLLGELYPIGILTRT